MELGCTNLVQHEIATSDNPSIEQHFRLVPFCIVKRFEMIDMFEKGIIQPSSSPWVSPIVLVCWSPRKMAK